MAIRFKSKLNKVKKFSLESRTPIGKHDKGVTNVADRMILKPDDFSYAGTDNDLTTITKSIPMSLSRMKFHLKLFNYYSVLSTESIEDIPALKLSKEKESFLRLPKVTNTKAGDVDVGCGHFWQRKYLQNRKKDTNQGKEVQSIENSMHKIAATLVTSTITSIENFNKQYSQRQTLREFYNSPKIIN